MISTTRHRFAPRQGPGYSLGEAARIRREFLRGAPAATCPRCHVSLQAIGTADSWQGVHMVSCPECGVSVVVHRRSEDR